MKPGLFSILQPEFLPFTGAPEPSWVVHAASHHSRVLDEPSLQVFFPAHLAFY